MIGKPSSVIEGDTVADIRTAEMEGRSGLALSQIRPLGDCTSRTCDRLHFQYELFSHNNICLETVTDPLDCQSDDLFGQRLCQKHAGLRVLRGPPRFLRANQK
jgi:hypothetical protein